MNLHVFRLDKFIPPFMTFCRERLPDHDNHFHVVDNQRDFPYQDGPDSHLQTSRLGYLKLFWKMYRARRIILHNLLDIHVVLFLALNPWLLKKCYWVIWGFDLYLYHQRHSGWKFRANECLRRIVIKRMGYLLTYVPGDVALARQWYAARGQHLECIMYPSNVFSAPPDRPRASNVRTLQVGNSADPGNNHFQVFDLLAGRNLEGWRVVVPLSYGDTGYSRQVEQRAEMLLPGKVESLKTFLAYEDYLQLLAEVDVAVFAHDRQQAMGNIITLLGMGKTVYMKDDISSTEYLRSLGITVFSVNTLDLRLASQEQLQRNQRIIQEQFSTSVLTAQWAAILES